MIEQTRQTKETNVTVRLDLDGPAKADIQTGIGFFDHMLTALALHAGWFLSVECQGDLHIDGHHTVEDVGIVLGDVFAKAIQERGSIMRYGEATIPMDEALACTVLDVSGRPFLVMDYEAQSPMVGTFDTQLAVEFYRAFAFHGKITLHADVLRGENDHHMLEALFKSTAHALRKAVIKKQGEVLSTKGSLDI